MTRQESNDKIRASNTLPNDKSLSKEHVLLLRAAKRVMEDLNERIRVSVQLSEPTPIYRGIADLHGAIIRSERARKAARTLKVKND